MYSTQTFAALGMFIFDVRKDVVKDHIRTFRLHYADVARTAQLVQERDKDVVGPDTRLKKMVDTLLRTEKISVWSQEWWWMRTFRPQPLRRLPVPVPVPVPVPAPVSVSATNPKHKNKNKKMRQVFVSGRRTFTS
jgi:hypothetical protein